MYEFDYHPPASLDDAASLLGATRTPSSSPAA